MASWMESWMASMINCQIHEKIPNPRRTYRGWRRGWRSLLESLVSASVPRISKLTAGVVLGCLIRVVVAGQLGVTVLVPVTVEPGRNVVTYINSGVSLCWCRL